MTYQLEEVLAELQLHVYYIDRYILKFSDIDAAESVLDHCTTLDNEKKTVTFSYEFVEDVGTHSTR